MTLPSDLEKRISKIEIRNKKVELDKKWETSYSRIISIVIITYSFMSLFFISIDVEKPFVNAIVPTFGFVLSTLSINIFKKIWIKLQ